MNKKKKVKTKTDISIISPEVIQLLKSVEICPDKFKKSVSLPRIVFCGAQSSGKSTLVESIVGHKFLPRGHNCCTKRPLQLELVRTKKKSFKLVDNIGNYKKEFENYKEVQKAIEEQTKKTCVGENETIKFLKEPLRLTIRSPNVVNLLIIDLPGVICVKSKDMEEGSMKLCNEITSEQISKDNTTVVYAFPAKQDKNTQIGENIKFPMERTIQVLTFMDVLYMERDGKERKKTLNEAIQTEGINYLETVAVVGRNTKDSVEEGRKKEKEWFLKNGTSVKDAGVKKVGTEVLVNVLQKILIEGVKKNIPSYSKRVTERLFEINDKLKKLEKKLEKKKVYNFNEESDVGQANIEFLSLIKPFFSSIKKLLLEDRGEKTMRPLGIRVHLSWNTEFEKFWISVIAEGQKFFSLKSKALFDYLRGEQKSSNAGQFEFVGRSKNNAWLPVKDKIVSLFEMSSTVKKCCELVRERCVEEVLKQEALNFEMKEFIKRKIGNLVSKFQNDLVKFFLLYKKQEIETPFSHFRDVGMKESDKNQKKKKKRDNKDDDDSDNDDDEDDDDDDDEDEEEGEGEEEEERKGRVKTTVDADLVNDAKTSIRLWNVISTRMLNFIYHKTKFDLFRRFPIQLEGEFSIIKKEDIVRMFEDKKEKEMLMIMKKKKKSLENEKENLKKIRSNLESIRFSF